MPLIIIGILLIVITIILWIQAAFVSKLDENIKKNHLVISGVYAWVRNPIYSTFMILCIDVLFIVGNV